MASLGMHTDGSSSNLQFLYRKPRKKARSCCTSCCFSCCPALVEVISGFIFLLVIATFFFLTRYFLEFSTIFNGHLTPNFPIKNKTAVNPVSAIQTTTTPAAEKEITTTATSITVSAAMETSTVPGSLNTQFSLTPTQWMSTVVVDSIVCQLFLGSFQALKETYQDQYNDSSSEAFQLKAEQVESMMHDVFMGSLLKEIYENASIFAISPSPFTVYFQLRFCNSSANGAILSSDTVVQALVNSNNGIIGQASILVNSSSVIVKGGARIFRTEGTIALSETCTSVSQDQSICWIPTTTEEIQIEMGASITCSNTTDNLYLTAMSPDLQSPGVKNSNAFFTMIRPFVEWIQAYTHA